MRSRLLALLAVLALLLLAGPASAQAPTPPVISGKPPFRLPFDTPPGPATWFVIQFYGNTRGAYQYRRIWYGQGLHFGIDFAAPCQTPVVAIGDGVVAHTDALNHGAGPHNLMILHANGLVSLYGHLYERPRLDVGQKVQAGQVVALTGDPDLTCHSRPHLHLEIRDQSYGYAFNPVPLIDADWNGLALFGAAGGFERDLSNPRRWVKFGDQPVTDFGGDILNDYAQPWPPRNW